jgi:hypothetical protein
MKLLGNSIYATALALRGSPAQMEHKGHEATPRATKFSLWQLPPQENSDLCPFVRFVFHPKAIDGLADRASRALTVWQRAI